MKITTVSLLVWSFLFCLHPQYEGDDGTLPLPLVEGTGEFMESKDLALTDANTRSGGSITADRSKSQLLRLTDSFFGVECHIPAEL